MFRIAAFARIAGVSAKTLRAWDELGLFRPAWIDPANAYRYYSPAQVPELRRIVALRDLGLPLGDVAGLVGSGADLRPVLERRRRELERERREVERRLRALDISVAMADGPSTGPDVVVRPVDAELVATLPVGPDAGDLGPSFYELEAAVRDQGIRASRPPGALIGPRGGADFRRDAVFVPVTRAIRAGGPITSVVLPACRVATVIHRGSYAGLAGAHAALRRWVAGAGHGTSGRLRILYLQFGAEPELRVPSGYLVQRDADFVTELQLELA